MLSPVQRSKTERPPEPEPEVVVPEPQPESTPEASNSPEAPAPQPEPPAELPEPPELDVSEERTEQIEQFVDENKDGKSDGWWIFGGGENSADRYADAMKGDSSLGDLTDDEKRLLTRGMVEDWRADEDVDQYSNAVRKLDGDDPQILREGMLQLVAADQAERAADGEAATETMTGDDSFFIQHVITEATYNDPEALVNAFQGQGARLGLMINATLPLGAAGDELLQAAIDGKGDPTTLRQMVDAMYLGSYGDFEIASGRKFPEALAATHRPGDTEADELAREVLEDKFEAFISEDRTSAEGVPPELRLAALNEIEANSSWSADDLKDGWESDVIGEWLAESSMQAYAGRGTEPQQLNGESLRNTIGQSMGIQPDRAPGEDATEAEMDAIYAEGMDHQYYGENENIDRVQAQILKVAGLEGADPATAKADVTIIPVTVTNNSEGATSVPVYRVETEDGPKFVDTQGRSYSSVEDWEENNDLPSGRMTYPEGMDMANADNLVSKNTPEVNDTWQEHALAVGDTIATIAGVAALGLFVVGTGGTGGAVLLAGGIGAGAWGAGRASASLYDDAQHGVDITDLSDPNVRTKWIEGIASGLSAGAGGVGLLARGGARLTATGARAAAAMNITATAADGAAVTNQAVVLADNWDKMKPGERASGLLNLAFYGGMTAMSLRSPGGTNADGMSFQRTANLFENGTPFDMHVNPQLATGEVRVAYDTDPSTGRVGNIRLQYNGSRDSLDPATVQLHSDIARGMESSAGLQGRISQLVTQSGETPKPGTAAWEAQFELKKIDTELQQINQQLSQGGLTPYEQAAANARLLELNTAIEQQQARLPQTDAEGQGWVSSPSRGSEQAQKLGWDNPPDGYHWVAQPNGEPRLDRNTTDAGPSLSYDPTRPPGERFVERPTPERGDLMPTDVVARQDAINSWMQQNGYDSLTSANAQQVLTQYRQTAQPPVTDAAGGQGTLAAVEVNGQTYVGMNSFNYNGGEGLALHRQWRDQLGLSRPGTDSQMIFHGEADALMQAYAANGGEMPSSVTLHTDNPPCGSCRNDLGQLANEMGIDNLRIEVSDGSVWTLQANGKITEGS
ncbi:DUF4781 domain-containing protein [Paracoccus sulfuroxidans]|uniref:tRNA-specific A34 adenosine deaminase n=1 Tax=Paracoccus sulfuroxidans TaxID=384678 RepID=A0A562NPD3_9RHOB|nr:DUF4781 domain-containing protein [Paracoccus sulfuroxidans]TWI33881.1 tRNA-specific A34 adenosine deaminase [Paracoccus sulfuroxidans]